SLGGPSCKIEVSTPYDPQNLSAYSYSRNDPIDYSDPTGLTIEGAGDCGVLGTCNVGDKKSQIKNNPDGKLRSQDPTPSPSPQAPPTPGTNTNNPSDPGTKVADWLASLMPDGPLVHLLQGDIDGAEDQLSGAECEAQEPFVCDTPLTGTFEAGGGSLLARAATKDASEYLAEQVELLYKRGTAGKKRAALAGLLQLEGEGDELLLTTSGEHMEKGLVPTVGSPGNPARFTARATGRNTRENDTEYKMLTYIANRLGGPSDVRGSLTLHSSQYACSSCVSVIGQFHDLFPNIRINYTSGRR
ncbi:deaminase domain-containing protein, partial [Streptomyces mangrovisoli]|uniref:deaminase domain-containing protein n=1 Tax=Streptomyces mangrovisoli TaxID=1428628 RepID=UPI0019D02642